MAVVRQAHPPPSVRDAVHLSTQRNLGLRTGSTGYLKHCQYTGLGMEYLLRDRDTKFTAAFDEAFKSADLNVVELQYRSPNTNAFVERFIQTLQRGSLDYSIILHGHRRCHAPPSGISHRCTTIHGESRWAGLPRRLMSLTKTVAPARAGR